MWLKRPINPSQRLAAGLRQLEDHLQTLIEGSAARFFPTTQMQHDLATSLVEAMRQGILPGADGVLLGPNLFRLEASPQQVEFMRADPALLEGLRRLLQEEGNEAGLRFTGPLSVQVNAVPDLAAGQVRVTAVHSQMGLTGTSTIETDSLDPTAGIPPNAFLIIDGMQLYPLRVAVLNIGRRADNHLVIDDQRISRVHAQLRLVRGQFVIFDLDSSGGTWVNGERIHQHALQPGDVISLSGLPLVFSQDSVLSDETQRMQNL
jgi:hypothetical protein